MLNNSYLKAFLIFFSGFVLSLCAPGYDLWFLAWIGLVPLFIIINTSKKINESMIYSFLFGLAYNLSYLHWLISMHPLYWMGFNNFQSIFISILAVVVVSVYNSMFFILFSVSVFLIKKFSLIPYKNGILNSLIIAFIWLIVFNKLSACKFLLGVPWTLIEYSQYKNLYLIQIAEYFGSLSISFLIVFFNMTLADLFIWIFNIERIGNRYIPRDPGKLTSLITSFSLIIVLIVLSVVSSLYLYWKNQDFFCKKSKTICVLQGNLPIKNLRAGEPDVSLIKKTYEKLINNNSAVLFVAPEGSLPTAFTQDYATQRWARAQATKKQSEFIFGSYCDCQKWFSNCAVYLNPEDSNVASYEKARLVPFGEFIPLTFILPDFLKKLASSSLGEGLCPGRKNAPFDTSLGKIGVTICFELIFPSILRKSVLEGAQILLNLSDLSWFTDVHVKQQFLSFAVFRAIENRRPVIISSNSGISVFVSPTGRIKGRSLPDTEGVLIEWVNPNSKKTFYTKYGW